MPIKARYVQHWLKTEREIPNHSAARIFAAATSILKAGSQHRVATRLPVLRSLGEQRAGIFYSGGVKKFTFDSASSRWDLSVAL